MWSYLPAFAIALRTSIGNLYILYQIIMRSADEVQKLIIDTAKLDDRIRAVLLNGSRADSTILPDKYQDFDIQYIVKNLNSFTCDHRWTNIFGERIIWQLPDAKTSEVEDVDKSSVFHYLMLFKDGNRIDLTLFPINKLETDFHLDSLTIVWIDKDNLFTNISKPNNSDYLIKKPTEKDFLSTCNEFWWVSTYVSKGLLRKEITYSKEMLEKVVRPMFMRIIEWYIGTKANFSVTYGKAGRFMNQFLTTTQYDKILATYSDQQIENNWASLLLMTELFGQYAKVVADSLNFQYNFNEEQNVTIYLKQ
ncbi:MAG TPA: aminoglycoside 6-adenylyltransferase, partial [Ignavibacteria bacterium]